MNKNKNRALEPKYYMTDIDLIWCDVLQCDDMIIKPKALTFLY